MIEDLMRADDNTRPRNSAIGGAAAGGTGIFGNFLSLDQLIQQISENDPNRFGPPPASKKSIENL